MMAKEITTGIALNLNDNFSGGIKNAGDTTQEFARDTKASLGDAGKSAETFAGKTLGATDKSGAAFEKFATKTSGAIKKFIKNGIDIADDAVDRFGTKTLGVINKVDRLVSGTAAKLAAVGLTFSLGAATKDIAEFEAQVTLMGVVAGMSDDEITRLKRDIYDVSHNAGIKLDYTKLQDASSVITDLTGDAKFAQDNLYLMGLAIRATQSDAQAIGALAASLKMAGLNAEESATALGTFAKQATQGAFTVRDFAAFGSRLINAYLATGREAKTAMKELGVMEALRIGVGTPDQAATAFEAVIRNLSSPDKIKKLKQFGVTVDFANQSIGEIMTKIIEATKGDVKKLYEWFDAEAVRAFNAGMAEYQRNLEKTGRGFVESYTKYEKMTGGIADLEAAADRNARTLAANFENLKSVFTDFVNSEGSGVFKMMNDGLNALSQNPENIKKVFSAITAGLIGIAAIKGIAGIARLAGSLARLKGGKLNITETLNTATAMPVYVTNWGGFGGGPPGLSVPPTAGSAGLVDQYGRPLASAPGITPPPALSAAKSGRQALESGKNALKSPKTMASGVFAGAVAAAYEIPEMLDEFHDIDRDESLTDKERGKAKGGAIGDASGSIAGAAGGAVAGGVLAAMATSALAGTALGTAFPGLGNIAGFILGAGIGAAGWYFGGKAGRAIGGGIGEALADDGTAQEPPEVRNRRGGRTPMKKRGKVSPKPGAFPEGVNGPFEIPASMLPPELTRAQTSLAPQKVELDGQADLRVHVDVSGGKPAATVSVDNSIRHIRFDTGHAPSARGMAG